jgi:Tol biopolymer transport system component
MSSHKLVRGPLVSLVALLLIALPVPKLFPPVGDSQRHSVELVTREVSLGKAHPGEIKKTRTLSPDRRHIAFVAKDAGGEFVVVDGVAGKKYAAITRDPISESGESFPIIFSPDSGRVSYVVKRGAKYMVVIDGKESAPYDYVRTAAQRFSPDSRRVAFAAKRGKKELIVVDGVDGKLFDDVFNPYFSEDSRRVAHQASQGGKDLFVVDGIVFDEDDPEGRRRFTGESQRGEHQRVGRQVEHDGKHFAVIDGVESNPYDSVFDIKFAPDQKRVIYTARLNHRSVVVVDGVEGKKYDWAGWTTFSPDGKHYAYQAQLSNEQGRASFVVLDGKEGQPYDEIKSLEFSPDGRLIYLARRERETRLVTGDVEGPSFDGLPGRIQFGPDGKRLIYDIRAIGSGEKDTLVIDGVPFSFDQIFNIEFSPDGHRLVFKVRRGDRWLMVIDGVETKEYDSFDAQSNMNPYSREDEIAFSPDSQRLAYVAQKQGKDMVVVDGVEGKLYEDIRKLTFTPDGQHVVYAAQRGNGFVIVADGVESKEYTGFLPDGGFNVDGDRTLRALATRGQRFLRVEIKIVRK